MVPLMQTAVAKSSENSGGHAKVSYHWHSQSDADQRSTNVPCSNQHATINVLYNIIKPVRFAGLARLLGITVDGAS